MDEQRRRRVAVVWTAFAAVMAYVTLAGGFAADASDLLGAVAVLMGLGLAYVYYANPNGVLNFGESDA
ncbi:hypothetical protein M0R88_05505 [Halorussus gelatinilyticus]|uniref:Uncharacterized protein n=1 Tax=Halorussus gelatinilyticus TaxID=2937524 RepID=A0A8U0IK99_9EURY|nr:hypothetical protein [Halorussus gelatinilyticus]UPW01560.1 hypothetical protein M0R88_05505 [Halorussus gelatinilyticus]